MSLIVADRVKETTTTTGTGALTLAGAVTGFQTFDAVCADSDQAWYCIAHRSTGEWEVGRGTFNAGTLSRDLVTASSNSGSAVSLTSGTKDVFLTVPTRAGVAVREGLFPPEQWLEFEISESQIRSLFSSPITLLPALAGYAHYLLGSAIYREAGTAYTLNSSTLLQFVVNGTAYTQYATSIFSGIGPYAQVGNGPAFQTFSVTANGQDNANKPLTLQTNVANLSGGSGRLFVSIFWRTFPNTRLGGY